MSKKIICPNCGSTAGFEEVLRDVSSSSLITIDKDGDFEFGVPKLYGKPSNQYYQCGYCGHILEGISVFMDFINWAEKHTKG